MKIFIFIFSFFLLANFSFAQVNLVPNGSFEIYDTCPNNTGQIHYASPWFQPTLGTTDYLNSCTTYPLAVPNNFWGDQFAHSGNAYLGFFGFWVFYDSIFTDYREYSEVKLDSSLRVGIKYFITFYVSLADSVNYATDAIGAYFSNDTVQNDTGWFLPSLVPQIENAAGNYLVNKTGWAKISGSYIAYGGEQFLTIGNFKNHINTNTISVSGGSTNIGQSDWWGGYYYLDDVCISTDSIYSETWTGIQPTFGNKKINIYPNPTSDFLFIENCDNQVHYSISNGLGQPMIQGKTNNERIDVSDLREGIYFLEINKKEFYKIIITH